MSKPNVLFISIDDLNDWVGAMGGHPQAITPNMDKLFKKGVLFTNAHASQAVCTASRNSLLSGLHPTQTGWYASTTSMRMDFCSCAPSYIAAISSCEGSMDRAS